MMDPTVSPGWHSAAESLQRSVRKRGPGVARDGGERRMCAATRALGKPSVPYTTFTSRSDQSNTPSILVAMDFSGTGVLWRPPVTGSPDTAVTVPPDAAAPSDPGGYHQ